MDERMRRKIFKNNHSFMRKRSGRTQRGGTVSFSVEKGNLRSINTFKHTGLLSKAIDIQPTAAAAGIILSVKAPRKAHICPEKTFSDAPLDKHFLKSIKVLDNVVLNSSYRPDLIKDVYKKYTAVYYANKRVKGTAKKNVVSRGRRGMRTLKR